MTEARATNVEDSSQPLSAAAVRAIVAEAMSQERQSVEARFVEQEHRSARILLNWYDGIRSERADLKRSAWLALLWNFLIPKPSTVAVVTGGILTLLITAFGVAMAYRANILVDRQTTRLDVQNLLVEAQRRTAQLNAELALLAPLIEAERSKRPDASNQKFELPPVLSSRVVALSTALRPYRLVEMRRSTHAAGPIEQLQLPWLLSYAKYIGIIDADRTVFEISDRFLSPERGSLLLYLTSNSIDVASLSGLDLRYALLDGLNLTGVDFSRINLANSAIDGGIFINVNFDHADLSGVQIKGATFKSPQFEGTDIRNSNVENSEFHNLQTLQPIRGAFPGQPICKISRSTFYTEADSDIEFIKSLKLCTLEDSYIWVGSDKLEKANTLIGPNAKRCDRENSTFFLLSSKADAPCN